MSTLQLVPVIVAAGFGAIAAIFWLVFSRTHRMKAASMEVRSKLLDTVNSRQDFQPYLDTEAGKRLLASIDLNQPSSGPNSRMLAFVRAVVIIFVLCIALRILWSPSFYAGRGPVVLASLAVALVAGFLITIGVFHRLSRQFGLFDRERDAGKDRGDRR